MILGLEDDKIAVHYTCNGTAITATKKVQKMGDFLIISQEAWLTKRDARQYLLLGKGKAVFQERCRLLAIMSNENKCEVLKM